MLQKRDHDSRLTLGGSIVQVDSKGLKVSTMVDPTFTPADLARLDASKPRVVAAVDDKKGSPRSSSASS